MKRKITRAILLLVFLSPIRSQGTDLTVVPGESGTDVVDATISKVNQLTEANGLLQADNRFLRRIAWVETADGTAAYTYSDPTYHGGIWRVDEAVFEATTRMVNEPAHLSIFDDIERLFCIRWSSASWEDCRKPLYSALAARLFFHHRGPSSIPIGLQAQAEKWESEYHDQPRPTDTAETFKMKVGDLERSRCRAKGIDLVFVLDGSGSVGETHFQQTKRFVLDVIDFFNISSSETRVGVIQFGRQIVPEFNLDSYSERQALRQAIDDIAYLSGPNTFTAAALRLVANESFSTESGGRPDSDGIPRVVVVVTDGLSNDEDGTNVTFAADSARAKDIVIFAIGVGSSINNNELNEIANKPNVTYVFHVSDFNAIDNIVATLEYTTCYQAVIVQNETINSTLSNNQIQSVAVPVTEKGVSLTFSAERGGATVYGSTGTANPSPASNDFVLMLIEGEEPVTVAVTSDDFNKTCNPENVRKRRQAESPDNSGSGSIIGTVYITIEGQQETNDFVLTVSEGVITDPSTTEAPITTEVVPTTVEAVSTKPDSTNSCNLVAATTTYVFLCILFGAQLAKTFLY